MDEEMKSITNNNTWELCNLPVGKKAIGLKWIYKTKSNAEGKIQKFKASVVAKGYSQKQRKIGAGVGADSSCNLRCVSF